MGLPNEYSTYCKNDKCSVFNLKDPYCEDCAKEKLKEAKIDKRTIKKVIEILYEKIN